MRAHLSRQTAEQKVPLRLKFERRFNLILHEESGHQTWREEP